MLNNIHPGKTTLTRRVRQEPILASAALAIIASLVVIAVLFESNNSGDAKDSLQSYGVIGALLTGSLSILALARQEDRATKTTERAIDQHKLAQAMATLSTYVQIRSGFHEIYRELDLETEDGDLNEAHGYNATSALSQRQMRRAYWHQSYDSWWLGSQLDKLLSEQLDVLPLWSDNFEEKVRSGYNHPVLQECLDELASETERGFGRYAGDFVAVVRNDIKPQERPRST